MDSLQQLQAGTFSDTEFFALIAALGVLGGDRLRAIVIDIGPMSHKRMFALFNQAGRLFAFFPGHKGYEDQSAGALFGVGNDKIKVENTMFRIGPRSEKGAVQRGLTLTRQRFKDTTEGTVAPCGRFSISD